jgi:hypothetical protein
LDAKLRDGFLFSPMRETDFIGRAKGDHFVTAFNRPQQSILARCELFM